LGNITLTAIHDEAGKVLGFLKITRDLTDKKKSEDILSNYIEELRIKNEALIQSEDRYHKMISEVKDYAIILLDKNGDIQNWNAGAEFIKGYMADEAIGKNFRIFYTEEDIEKNVPDNLIAEASAMGKATSEGWRKRKDGSKFWGSVVITALHDKGGDVIGFSKVTRDLTGKKKIEDALKKKCLRSRIEEPGT
jgi:PAS domain S-box-containing protein